METINSQHWFGFLTIENSLEVAQVIKAWLTGKRYTFVSALEHGRIEARTSQHLDGTKMLKGDPLRHTYFADTDHAHFFFSDSYGTWGLSTTAHDEPEARAKLQPFLSFDRGVLRIEHYNGLKERLTWLIVPEADAYTVPGNTAEQIELLRDTYGLTETQVLILAVDRLTRDLYPDDHSELSLRAKTEAQLLADSGDESGEVEQV